MHPTKHNPFYFGCKSTKKLILTSEIWEGELNKTAQYKIARKMWAIEIHFTPKSTLLLWKIYEDDN